MTIWLNESISMQFRLIDALSIRFGHSQRRDALLAPRAMGEFIIRAADAFDHPHVVGPDIGTGAELLTQFDGSWSRFVPRSPSSK